MESTAIPLDKLGIPPELAKYVEPATPREVKLLAARGLIPAPPKVLIAIQYCLLADPEPAVVAAGRDGLMGIPAQVLIGAIDDRTHPKILEFFAFNRHQDDKLIEALLLKRQLNDRSICYLAEVVGPRLFEMIASNQERLLLTPIIFRHLQMNPNASKAVLDRTESFLRMYHVYEEIEAAEAAAAAAAAPAAAPVVAPVEVPVQAVAPAVPLPGQPLEFKHGFEQEEEQFDKELVEEPETIEEKVKDLWGTISKLPISKKIKLAYTGNASVRGILVRDSNRMVATAVMKSPRITDNEVINFAKNRNLCDDIFREIARNKEWFKMYAVKVSLVNNPKCPISISVPIVNQLMSHDLKQLAKNKNVSSVIQTTAKQALGKKST